MDRSRCNTIFRQLLILVGAMVLFALCMALTSCSSEKSSESRDDLHQVTNEDFATARVATVIGTTEADTVVKIWPNAEMYYFNTMSDVITALNTNKVDCAGVSADAFETISSEHPNLVQVEESIDDNPRNRAWAFPKGSTETTYYKQMNEYVAQCKEDGTMAELRSAWLSPDHSSIKIPDFSTLEATNGILHLVASADEEPFNYWNGDKLSGFDIDFAYHFAQEYGYGLTIDVIPFESLILGIASGAYDFAAESLSVTEERAQAVDFTDPFFPTYSVAVYNIETIEDFIGAPVDIPESAASAASGSLLQTLQRVFVTGDRWKLAVSGLQITLIITIFSTILATLLAYALVLIRRRFNRIGNTLVNIYIKLFQGTPVLVMLLIFYYVIFGKANMSAVIIATLVFSMNSAAYIAEALYADICAVDPGQREAALAAGYTEHQTFLRFILPPAVHKLMPVYRGEVISLMKSTSIVGYVALIDLTKAGDIIRSQTYEAVVPLVSIAVVYLLLSWLISIGLKAVEKSLTPKEPLTQIKGVDMAALENFDAEAAASKPLVDCAALGEPGELLIKIEHLRKEYPNVIPLSDVNACIHRGDVISIIGPSGTGKSTLLRMINQLEMPTSGSVYLEEECITDGSCDINKVRQKMGMVFQSFNLYGRLSVVENIMVGPTTLKGMDKQVSFQRALELLERVGLTSKALNYPHQLSGGQKQRVAIARAVAMDSDILLLDEPTSALDPKMVGEVQRVIANLAKAGMTMMIVTHEMSFAKKVSNRIFYMDEGVIYEDGTPEQIFENPQRPKTRDFVFNLNRVSAKVSTADPQYTEMAKSIEEFAEHNLLSPKTCYRLNLLYEELVLNGILPSLSSDKEAEVIYEYSQETGLVVFKASYGGNELNPFNQLDELAQTLISRCSQNYQHRYAEGVNHVEAVVG